MLTWKWNLRHLPFEISLDEASAAHQYAWGSALSPPHGSASSNGTCAMRYRPFNRVGEL